MAKMNGIAFTISQAFVAILDNSDCGHSPIVMSVLRASRNPHLVLTGIRLRSVDLHNKESVAVPVIHVGLRSAAVIKTCRRVRGAVIEAA